MRILIAGAAGFIGSHALDHFVSKGDDVWVIDALTYAGDVEHIKKYTSIYKGKFLCEDIVCDHEVDRWVKEAKPDVVVNFAAETHVDNSIRNATPFIRTNFQGACNLMKACRDVGALYTHISTDEVYGVPDAIATRGFIESDPLNPQNPYSASKAAADMMLVANKNTHGQEFLAVRPSNNFGPYQHAEKFLPKLINCLTSKQSVDFPLYGDGKQIREWTYARDTVKIIRNSIVNGTRGFLNVTSKVSMQNVDVIEMVKNILEKEGNLVNPNAVKFVKDRPGHDRRYWIESSISRNEFTSFDTALHETIRHYLAKK
jgi:dTDP-glucose 4,6-dehydratase